jgi:hypothetical protein
MKAFYNFALEAVAFRQVFENLQHFKGAFFLKSGYNYRHQGKPWA